VDLPGYGFARASKGIVGAVMLGHWLYQSQGDRSEYNDRFMVPAAEEGACYRAMESGIDLDTLFCFKYQRTVGMDNIVRFGGDRLQLLPGPRRRSWARANVEVQERLDGSLAVFYHGECLVTTPAPLEAPLLRARGGRRGVATGMRPVKCVNRPGCAKLRSCPSNHRIVEIIPLPGMAAAPVVIRLGSPSRAIPR